jgi:hypothetical protein
MATFVISWRGGWYKRELQQHVDFQLNAHFAMAGLSGGLKADQHGFFQHMLNIFRLMYLLAYLSHWGQASNGASKPLLFPKA